LFSGRWCAGVFLVEEAVNSINLHFEQVLDGLNLLDETEIKQVIMTLAVVRKLDGTVYLFGNGGSHATAGHFANDLVKMCGIRAVCVGDMTSAILAYGNDNGWDNMFVDLLEKMMEKRDCAFGISCSGNSTNVIRALEMARNRDVLAVGLTGESFHSVINDCALDGLVHTPGVNDIRAQEDLHLMICHAVSRCLMNQ
jgi:D-sedoheptulose 7-phosphate isomerase